MAVLRLAIWLGLLVGVLEASAAMTLRAAGWPTRVPPAILWIAPVFNLAWLALAGAGLAGVLAVRPLARFRSHAPIVLLWIAVFAVLQAVGFLQPWSSVILGLGVAIALSRRMSAPGAWDRLVVRTRRVLLVVGALFIATGLIWEPLRERRISAVHAETESQAPNVIVVTLDTVRADHLSAMGYERHTTPNLDRLADRGVLFEHAFATSSWTLPSHASLLTGLYAHQHGADWFQPMADLPTITEALADAGYATAAFAANTSYVTPEWGLGRGFSRFEAYGPSWADLAVRTALGRRLALNLLPRVGYWDIPGRKRASQLNREFLRWLDGIERQPFFALLNYLDAHDPYLTDETYHRMFSDRPAAGDVINFQFQSRAFRRKSAVSETEIQAEIDAYDGCIAYLDAAIGRLLAALSERGLTDNTIVVITSDHGESFGNHDLFGHGNSLYLETLHVPLIVAGPIGVPAGTRIAAPVGIERVPATIQDLIGVPTVSLPGRSLRELWTGGHAPAVPVLSEVSRVDRGPSHYPTRSGGLVSLIDDRWHLLLPETGDPELYRWQDDRQERLNLAQTAEGIAIVERMSRVVANARQAGNDAEPVGGSR